jgi:hypothetical protein
MDVYSFGMLLLAMCVETPLLEYLSARWYRRNYMIKFDDA